MAYQSTTPSLSSNFVLVVDNNGDMDILQVSYDTLWKDLCIVLQVKFEYEETPSFTYTNNEEESVCLDSQESFEEALKLCKTNSDVLHIQIRHHNDISLLSPSQRQELTNRSSNYEFARTAFENSLDWVRSTFNRRISNDATAPSTGDSTTGLLSSQISNEVSDELRNILQTMNESRAQSLVDTSHQSQTTVKEPVGSQCDDISVSTSALGTDDNEAVIEEEQVVEKEPVVAVSNRENQSETNAMNSEMIDKIKEEVQLAISKELFTFRQQIAAELVPSKGVHNDDCEGPSTSRDMSVNERPRSPTEIRSDIRKLKQEMREAKQLKKLKRQKELEMLKKKEVKNVLLVSQPMKVRKYAASFICENLLDGSCVGIGQQFVKYWVLKNEGLNTWDYQIELKLIEEKTSDDGSSVDPESIESGNGEEKAPAVGAVVPWGAEKTGIPMPTVENDKTAVIAVSHVAPNFPCIYTSSWRLCHGDKLFGPRIWCKVTVKANVEAPAGNVHSSLMSEDRSFSSKSWLPSRKLSTAEDVKETGDDLSNMLSFDMAAVGDFTDETTRDAEQTDKNFNTSPPTSTPGLDNQEATEVKEEEEEEVSPEDDEPISILVVDSPSIYEVEESAAVKKESIPQDESNKLDDDGCDDETEQEAYEETDELDDVAIDASSDVPSDFEVIPIPECFDTSKPLAANQEEEKSLSLDAEKQVAEDEVGLVGSPDVRDESKVDDDNEVTEDNVDDDSSVPQQSSIASDVVAPQSSSILDVASSSSVDTQPKQLSTTTTSLPKSVCTPSPVPQSVLDLDEPYPVQDYSTGYATPVQKTVPPQEPLTLPPIPLPRGVLDAEKPWVKPDPVPSPHPRLASASHGETSSSHSTPTPASLREEPSTSGPSPPVASSSTDPAPNPSTILYPSLADPIDDDEEYLLAPEAPTKGSRLPICTPPGYRVPNSPPSSIEPPTNVNESPNPALSPLAPPHDPPFVAPPHEPSPLEQLVDMGFLDIDLNEDLLKEFQGDLNKVVNALVYRGSGNRSRGHTSGRRSDGTYIC